MASVDATTESTNASSITERDTTHNYDTSAEERAALVRQTNEGGQELRPRSSLTAKELMREVGAVLRLSEKQAAELGAIDDPR